MNFEKEQLELEELYQQAKVEMTKRGDKLVVWAGGDAVNQQDAVSKAFSEKFPDIPIDIKVELSSIHDLTIYKELLNGDLTPDVAMLQTANDYEDWKKMDVLTPFKSASFNAIRDELKDEEGYFSTFRMFAFVPQYAKEGIDKTPENITDLITPEYNERLVLTYPHDDDAVLYMYNKLIERHGQDILADIAKLNPVFVRGTAGPLTKTGLSLAISAKLNPVFVRGTAGPPLLVGRNGFLGTLTGYETAPNQPSQSFIPKDDDFISWGQRIATFKLSKHPATAKLFIAFVQSHEFQESLGTYSVRKDIDFGDNQWIGSYNNTNPVEFYDFMRDRAKIGELRKLMKSHFGPVEGVSPVVDHETIKLTYNYGE